MAVAIGPGRPFPLGVTLEGDAANVALFSAHAERIELCLFDASGEHETARLALPACTDQVFHGSFAGLAPGRIYGFRAHGPWAPEAGHRFNPAKLLLDPHARAVTGRFRWAGPNLVDLADPWRLDPRDSAPFVPKALLTAPTGPAPLGPRVPWERTILYEAHVKDLTKLHPDLPPRARGSYPGLAHPRVIEHLVRLGITAVELLPVAAFLDELRLVRLGLTNHWGYNPYAFLALEPRYAAFEPLPEFRTMVTALHEAGIEVILDVVFNHTAESDHHGPTLSFRGLDNASYYRLEADDPRHYVNWAGTGNTLNLGHPRVLQLVMDALRHWAALGVDGFRFDLATTLGRTAGGSFSPEAPFLQAIAQDPVLGGLKLIAEPWDLGPDGYRQGQFPAPFAMWNDRFRDAVRRFWRGDEAVLPELAGRLLGSADLYDRQGRGPQAGVNFVTSHDGFTLKDLVTYAARHNQANGENNRDGHHENFSSNGGVEGPSDDTAIHARRDRRRRSLLATLMLAQGVPMLLMGDELGRTQAGNNNAYCQDNPLSWVAWEGLTATDAALSRFVRRLVALRKAHPLLSRPRFLHGRTCNGDGIKDVTWLDAQGREMTEARWREPGNHALALLLADEHELLLLLANAHGKASRFLLPTPAGATSWRCLLDSAEAEGGEDRDHLPGGTLELAGCSLVLLRSPRHGSPARREGRELPHRPLPSGRSR